MKFVIIRSTFAVLAAIALAAPAAAQNEPLALTVEDAVRRAIENNPDLTIVRLDSDVDAARAGEARTTFTPVFSTVLGRSSVATPPLPSWAVIQKGRWVS